MHRYFGLPLIWTVVAAMTPSNLSAADPERAVDIGSFLKELMVLRVTGHNIHLAYWYPNEFLTEVLVAEGNSRAVAESNAAVFRPYLALIVHQSNEGTDGVVRHASSESLRARAGLRSENGDEVKPLEVVPRLSRFTSSFCYR